MKRSRFSDEQIIGVLKEHQASMPSTDLCRKYGVSDATFYKWRSEYGGMEVSEARRLKELASGRRRFGYRRLHILLKRASQPPIKQGKQPRQTKGSRNN